MEKERPISSFHFLHSGEYIKVNPYFNFSLFYTPACEKYQAFQPFNFFTFRDVGNSTQPPLIPNFHFCYEPRPAEER